MLTHQDKGTAGKDQFLFALCAEAWLHLPGTGLGPLRAALAEALAVVAGQ